MARVPQEASVDVQVAVRELNDELTLLKRDLKNAKSSIPSTKAVEELQGAVTRLSKTPTYLDPNDVFRGSGPAHMHGYVTDPGETAGGTRFLHEDGTWQEAGVGSGTVDHNLLLNRSLADQHPASAVTFTPSGLLSAATVQAAIDEHDSEKLARSGVQDMLGNLDMGGNEIQDAKDLTFTGGVGEARIDDVRKIDMTGIGVITDAKLLDMSVAAVSEGIINAPRVIHMAGDDTDSEARIDGLERTVFNDEPTKSVIDNPSRLEWNTGVEAGVSYTAAEGQTSWDNVEDTMVVWVASGAGLVAVAVGWAVKIANGGLLPS